MVLICAVNHNAYERARKGGRETRHPSDACILGTAVTSGGGLPILAVLHSLARDVVAVRRHSLPLLQGGEGQRAGGPRDVEGTP